MLHKSLAKRRKEDGFTLIELLVVVVIIGILIGIAIPVYLNYRKNANDKSAQSDLRNAVATLELCYSDTGSYPTEIEVDTDDGACDGQRINTTDDTTLTYEGSAASWTAVANNSGGSGNYYCYNSATGGSVVALDPEPASAAAALAACKSA